MFTNFDKALAGGLAAWITNGIAAGISAIFMNGVPLDAGITSTIGMIVGAILVYVIPNKAVK